MTWLDDLTGVQTLQDDGTTVTSRGKINAVGGVSARDNAAGERTDLVFLTTTVVALSAAPGAYDGQHAKCECHTTRGDGGGGSFVWYALSTETADGGTILGTGTGRWKRVYSGEAHAAWFGAGHAAIISAISAASAAGIRILRVKAGTYVASQTMIVPSNMELIADGVGCVFEMPVAANYRVVDLDGVSNVTIRGVRVTRASGVEAGGLSSYAVAIRGACDNILLDRVECDGGLRRNIAINGSDGTVPGTATRITLRDCRSDDSLLTFGYDIDWCETVTLDNCVADGNHLEGFKLRAKTRKVVLDKCKARGNAQDGLNAYAGGDQFTAIDCDFSDNLSCGILIKTGALNVSDPTNYGAVVGRCELTGNRCNGNIYGLQVTVSDYGDLTQQVPCQIQINGGEYADNSFNGMLVVARNVVINHPLIRANGRDGLVIGSRAFDVTMNDPIVIANSHSSAGTYSGIVIDASYVTLNGGRILGVDGDLVGQESDYSSLTKYHKYNIDVTNAQTNVLINRPEMRYQTNAAPVRFQSTAQVIAHWIGTGTPASWFALGTAGSTFQNKTASSPGDAFWVKTAGLANENNVGWRRVVSGPATTSATLNFGSIAAGASADLTITVTGAATTDAVASAPQSALEAGLIWNAFVSAADTVTIRVSNITALPIDPASRLWAVRTFTQEG